MMWTKIIFVAILLACLVSSYQVSCETVDSVVVDAIPPEVNTEAELLIDENLLDDEIEPKSYRGAQLWRLSYKDQQYKSAVSELQKTYRTSIWNIQMANSSNAYVDLFVKPAVVDDAREFLRKVQVPFNVIMDDVQDAIDSENPPLDETDLWQNRDGEARKGAWIGKSFSIFVKSIAFLMTQGWDNLINTMGDFTLFECDFPSLNVIQGTVGRHPMTWTAYHNLDDILQYMDFLAKSYPNLCGVKTIGKSLENRPIKVLRISNGDPSNKAVWIDAGIHAREWISPAAVTYVIDHLVANWDSETLDMKSIDWYFLPVMNPDGYAYTHNGDRLWRKNKRRHTNRFCTGVDLNRNYGHKWGGQGASKQACSETFAGSSAFSEPETKAVNDFLKKSGANFKASLSFHSYGQYILYPWGYDRKVPADHQDLDRVAREAAEAIRRVEGKVYTVGPAGSTLYPAAGGSDDWAKGDLKLKYSYTIELRDEGRYGFMLPANQIIGSGDESLAFARVLARNLVNA